MSRVPVLGTVTPPGSALLPLPRGMSLQSDTRCRPGWQPGFRGEQPLFALRCREMKGSRTRPWTCLRCRWLRGNFRFLCSSPGSPQSPRCSQLPNGLGDREGSPLPGCLGDAEQPLQSRLTGHSWGLGTGGITQEIWDEGQIFQTPDQDFIRETERIIVLCLS